MNWKMEINVESMKMHFTGSDYTVRRQSKIKPQNYNLKKLIKKQLKERKKLQK